MNIRRKIIYAVGIIAFLITLPFIYLGTLWIWYSLDDPKGSCIYQDFNPEQVGNKISCEVVINTKQGYALQLVYFHIPNGEKRSADRERIWKIVGGHTRDENGNFLEPGAPLKLNVKIVRSEDSQEQVVFDSYISSPKLSSWGANDLYANLVEIVMDKGKYKIFVESMIDSPEMKSVKTGIVFGESRPVK